MQELQNTQLERTAPEYYSVFEVAARLGLNTQTVRNWINDPEDPFPGFKIGKSTYRIPAQDFETYLESLRKPCQQKGDA